MKRLLCLVALFVTSVGCGDLFTQENHNLMYGSSDEVQAYADQHQMSYKDALAELRDQTIRDGQGQ